MCTIILFVSLLVFLIWFIVKVWFNPKRIKSMSNEQIREERIKRGMDSSSVIPDILYTSKKTSLMNHNKLLKAIRMYTGKSTKEFAKALGTAKSTISVIEKSQLNIYHYYEAYAKQANIPTWLILFLISEEDTNTLQGNLKKSAEHIIDIYYKLDFIDDNSTTTSTKHEAKQIVARMNTLLLQLEKLL